ncbi:unnamed protein product [Adineta ricciae]|uniref:Uncharacterized protein n=1 Tax=Adineta ricciae TaxID=249248 RepID=A0A815V6T4_ADIRI|nr:unnamed protein product [Adineta ricciae]CAF1526115.1 unnamed protein product [Adineta ricciae]
MTFLRAAVVQLSLMNFLPLNQFNVYNYLWRHYGASTSKFYGQCVKTHIRLNKLKYDLQFLRTCKRENLMPNFTNIRLANPYLYNSKLIYQCRLNILQAEFKFKKRIYTQTYKHAKRLRNELKEYVLHIIYVRLETIMEQIVLKKMIEVEDRQEGKLQLLRYGHCFQYALSSRTNYNRNNDNNNQPMTTEVNKNGLLTASFDEQDFKTHLKLLTTAKFQIKSVTNLSKKQLSYTETIALSNGLHHVYPPEVMNETNFICNIENYIE